MDAFKALTPAAAMEFAYASPTGFIITDVTGLIQAANPAAQRLLITDIIGKRLPELLPPPHDKVVQEYFTLRAQLPEFSIKQIVLPKDGLEIMLDLNCRTFIGGNTPAVLVMMHPLDPGRAGTEEVARLRRLARFSDYAPGITHNINNPLAVIIGRSQLMELKYPEVKGPAVIAEQAHKIKRIVEVVSQKSQLEHALHTQALDLNQLLDIETQFINAMGFYRHCIRKEFHIGGALPRINGVYGDIAEAVMHWIHFALVEMKTTTERTLFLSTGYDNRNVWLEIRSTGIGFPPEVVDRLDEPGYLPPVLTTEEHRELMRQGLDFDLARAKQLLDLVQGEASVISQPGLGTTITLRFRYVSLSV